MISLFQYKLLVFVMQIIMKIINSVIKIITQFWIHLFMAFYEQKQQNAFINNIA